MKIIAVTGNTVILEASIKEVNWLAGKDVVPTNSYNWEPSFRAVGVEFAIREAFEQIHRNDKRKEEIDHVRKHLEVIIAQLDMTVPFLSEPTIKPEESSGSV